MKRILFTTVSLGVLGLMSPALVADLSVYTKAPAVVAPMYDWSGFYVGVFGGGGEDVFELFCAQRFLRGKKQRF